MERRPGTWHAVSIMRARPERRWSSLTEHRLVRMFTVRAQWVRRVVVTSMAAALAWVVADSLLAGGGVTAAIAAVITIQVSLHKSLREGFAQILGTGIGAGVGVLASDLVGLGFITVMVTVALASVAARALGLGAAASINVVITALIVIGPGPTESTAAHRLIAIVAGSLVGIGLSYFSHAKTPAGRTVDEISELATAAAQLLADMATGVSDGVDRAEAATWLARGRALVARVPRVRAQAAEARDYSRWFPLAERSEAEDLYTRAVALDHAVEQVRSIARTLFDTTVDGAMSATLNARIADALATASYAMSASVVELRDEIDAPLDPAVTEDVRQAGAGITEQLIDEHHDVAPEQLEHGISIATHLSRMADSLDQSSPAIREVPDPGPPTEELVLRLPGQRRRRRRHR